eukprot:1160224-Pelagomonas_calceolata.AAC.16
MSFGVIARLSLAAGQMMKSAERCHPCPDTSPAAHISRNHHTSWVADVNVFHLYLCVFAE